MHPILLDKPLNQLLPPYVLEKWVPYLSSKWQLWLTGLVVSFLLAWWGMAPNSSVSKRLVGWLGTLGSLGFLLCLSSLGLKNPQFTLQLHTYGVLIAIGFLVGILIAVREAKQEGISPEKVLDLSFWILIASMLGARLAFVGTHLASFKADWAQHTGPWYTSKIFRLWEGGLLFYGGFGLAILVCFVFVKVNKLDFWKLADAVIPAVVIGQFLGQMGNFAAGFSYGKDAGNLSWAVQFTHKNSAALKGVPLHPTQMYMALGLILLFFFLMWRKQAKQFHGHVFLSYLLLFPLIDFFVGIFQGDPARGMIFEKNWFTFSEGIDVLSWSQGISMFVFSVALFLFFNKTGKSLEN